MAPTANASVLRRRETERSRLQFVDPFERRFIDQGEDEDRSARDPQPRLGAVFHAAAGNADPQKRVNAMKYNIVPRYQATVQHIRAALEEDERNTLFQIKVLRAHQPG